MNTTVSAGGASSGAAVAIVVILSWILSLCHVTLPAEVGTALTGLIGFGLHWLAARVPPAKGMTLSAAPGGPGPVPPKA